MKKIIVSIIGLFFIALTIPISMGTAVLETVFNPTFLTRPSVIETIHEVAITELGKQIDEGAFTLHENLNKQETKEVLDHMLTQAIVTEIAINVSIYLDSLNTPYLKHLPPFELNLIPFKDYLTEHPPPNIPKQFALETVRHIPSQSSIEIPIEGDLVEVLTTTLAWRNHLVKIFWTLLVIPTLIIVLILRKEPCALFIMLGSFNLIAALILSISIRNITHILLQRLAELQMSFIEPIGALIIKHFHTKVAIFGMIGIILLAIGAVLCHKKSHAKS